MRNTDDYYLITIGDRLSDRAIMHESCRA
jgi:hypothetical protein